MISKGELEAVEKTLETKWLPKAKAKNADDIVFAGGKCSLCAYHGIARIGDNCNFCVLHDEGMLCCNEFMSYLDATVFEEKMEATLAVVKRLESIIKEEEK